MALRLSRLLANSSRIRYLSSIRELPPLMVSWGNAPGSCRPLSLLPSLCGWGAMLRRPCSSSVGTSHVVAMGTRVTLTYKAALNDGLVFDDGLEPITFVCGEGAMVSGFHKGIVGMVAGETKELIINPADGFGEWDKKLVVKAPIDKMPDGCKVGTRLSLGKRQGDATIVALTDEYAMLDRNHPLAGKQVKFTVNLISCEEVPKHEQVIVETVSPGDGVTFPKPGDTLTMHYVGTLEGSSVVFDSSRDRGEPLTFTIGVQQVIEGWDEGVVKMSLGERAVLKVPSAKAYGSKGAGGGLIPPNADLTFEVELLKIN